MLNYTNQPYWQSPLHDAFAAFTSTSGADAAITLTELPRLGYIILRGQVQNTDFLNAVDSVLDDVLPTQAMQTIRTSQALVLWLSPDEWLVITSYENKDELLQKLLIATAGQFAQVVDNSGGYTSLRLNGEAHMTVLRHLTPFDVESLQMSGCAASIMSKSGVILVRTDDTGMTLVCRRSFADYIWRLIQKAAKPYGLVVDSSLDHIDATWRGLCI